MAWAWRWCLLALWLGGWSTEGDAGAAKPVRDIPRQIAKAAWLQSTGYSASFRGKVLNLMDYLAGPGWQFLIAFQVR